MAKIRDLIEQRFSKKEKSSKMASLALKTTEGSLTSFAGIFGSSKLSDDDREKLSQLLLKYAPESESDIEIDLDSLASITAEVRAINNQAAILHGERIKRAQEILKRYRDGAFTAWLMTTYGNRQTPYNFLQYYIFYLQMPHALHPQIEAMPRQAIYTLASRDGSLDEKAEIVKNYRGETKEEILNRIRSSFPLREDDRRREDLATGAIHALERLFATLSKRSFKISKSQKEKLESVLEKLLSWVRSL